MDENDIIALLSGEEPSGKAKTLATAAALRRQRAAGNLGLLTGDRVLGGFGASQVRGADVGEERQDRAGEREASNRARLLTLALGERERAADNARADRAQVLQRTRDEEQRRWQERQNELNRRAQIMAAEAGAGRKIASEGRAEEKKKEASVREVEERYQNMMRSLGELEDRVAAEGTNEFLGPHNALLEGAITSFAVDAAKLRDPTSVAREGEVELEKKALFKPGSLTTKDDTALALIRRAKERMSDRRAEAYKVRGLAVPEAQAATPVDDERAAAAKWAKANPTDPRAAAILEALK